MKRRVLTIVLISLFPGLSLFAADGDLIVNGNVGIGTTSPVHQLTVAAPKTGDNNAYAAGIDISTNGEYGSWATPKYTDLNFLDYLNTVAARIRSWDQSMSARAGILTFSTSSSGTLAEAMRIDAYGNVGIGTTSPTYPLHVNGATYCTSGTWAGSDISLKKNIEPIKNGVSLIQGLQGVRFEWKREEFKDRNLDDGKQIGLIAEDVEKVLPELVKTDKEGYKALSYEKLTAVLVEAIKDQQKQIDELRAEVARLGGR